MPRGRIAGLLLVLLAAGLPAPTGGAPADLGPLLAGDGVLVFEPNRGQAAASAPFLARGPGLLLHLHGATVEGRLAGAAPACEPQGPVLPACDAGRDAAPFSLRFVGGRDGAVRGEDSLPGVLHYARGADPARWARDVPRYARAVAEGVYPGIDVAFRSTPGAAFEYDFLVAPGADPSVVTVAFGEAVLDGAGRILAAPGLVHGAPVAFQAGPDGPVPVAARWEPRGPGAFGFSLGAYDRSRLLVIDPKVVAATVLGGSGLDAPAAVAAASGAVFVAGRTASPDFAPAERKLLDDAFVARLAPDGTPVWITFLGGNLVDLATGLAVDGDRVILAGTTGSPDFPATEPAVPRDYNRTYAGSTSHGLFYSTEGAAVFERRLPFPVEAPAGTGRIHVAQFGRESQLTFRLVDAAGRVLRSSTASSADWEVPLLPGAHEVVVSGAAAGSFRVDIGVSYAPRFLRSGLRGDTDAFLAALDSATGALRVAGTYGGYGREYGGPVAIGADRIHLAGPVDSADFLWFSPGSPSRYAGAIDGYHVAVGRDLATIHAAAFHGGSGTDVPRAVAARGDHAVIGGATNSLDLPVRSAAQAKSASTPCDIANPAPCGFSDGYALSTAPGGFATYVGGPGADAVEAIAIDPAGRVFLGGVTEGELLRERGLGNATAPPFRNGFVIGLAASNATFAWGAYLGGSENETVRALASRNDLFVAGTTASPDLPLVGPFQARLRGPADAFVARLSASGELLGASYLGGDGEDVAVALVAHPTRASVLLVGETLSPDFPQTAAGRRAQGRDVFFAEIDAAAPDAAPGAPRGVVARSGPHAGAVTLNWTAPVVENGWVAADYRVERRVPGGAYAPVAVTRATTFTDAIPGAGRGAAFEYRITALVADRDGVVLASSAATSDLPAWTPSHAAPVAALAHSCASGISGVPGTAAVRLSWQPPPEPGERNPAPTLYRVYRATVPEATTGVATADAALGVSGSKAGRAAWSAGAFGVFEPIGDVPHVAAASQSFIDRTLTKTPTTVRYAVAAVNAVGESPHRAETGPVQWLAGGLALCARSQVAPL